MAGIGPADAGDLSVQALGPDAGKAPERPRISSPEEAAKLAPGTTFIGPDDKERVVPYRVDRPEQIANLPDGADFMGPDGVLRQKPHYEGIDFTAQTLYDMSVNDKERRKALERSYPGKVRDDPAGGFYVDDDGVSRKPGRGLQKIPAAIAGGAAPTILSVLGALGGGAVGGTGGAAAGSVVPVAGTVAGGLSGGTAGAAVGGATGAMLGQGFNDLILGLSGVLDRSHGEELIELGLAAAGGSAGAGVGRGISTVVPSLRSGVSALTAAAPGLARGFLGAGKEDLQMARGLAEKGVQVPPSAWAKEAPHLQNMVEVFDPAFDTSKPLVQSATAHYEKSAGDVLRALGIKDPGSLTKPLADVPAKEAGEAVIRRTLGELNEADARMQAALDAKKAALGAGQSAAEAQRETVLKAADEARTAAQKVIDAGYKDIEADIKTGMQVAKADANAGDLWGLIGQKLMSVRRAVGQRAKVMYDAADQAAGGHLPNVEGLSEQATQFLEGLPGDFQQKYPDIVKKMRDFAGVPNPPKGAPGHIENESEWIKEPVNPTFGQLHNLRSQLRSNIHYSDLTPDQREGAYKFFQNKVDAILHGINEEGPAFELKTTEHMPRNVFNEPQYQTPAYNFKWGPFEAELLPTGQNGQYWVARLERMKKDRFDAEGKGLGPSFYQEMASYLASKGYKLRPGAGPPSDYSSGGKKLAEKLIAQGGIASDGTVIPMSSSARQASLKEASQLLRDADAFYADNIKLFNAQQVKAVMKGLEAGEPADPQNLYNVVVKSGQTDLTNAIKEKVGPNLWAGVKAADMQAMLDASKTLTPGVVDGRTFAREVLERYRNGTLEVVHGKEASEKLLEQARRIEMLDGRLAIPVRPGDTMTQVIARARQAEELAKAEAKRDPLATLNKEMRQVEIEHKRAQALAARERRKDPLGFLYDPTTGAVEAVDKILGKEDLILAAAAKFGENSPEFNMLRQVWAQRLLTGTMKPGDKLAGVAPEIQQVMFPGISLKQMQTLAKEMHFLMESKGLRGGGDTAAGMSAMAKVEHPPLASLRGVAKRIPVMGIATEAGARAALGKFYRLARTLSTRPAMLRWLEKGLNGSPTDREVVRQSIAAVLQKGGAVGAGTGEAIVQGSGPE